MHDGDYDVLAVGGRAPLEASTGELAARRLRVAVVEPALIGGECSYGACIPSKSLLRPGEAVHWEPVSGPQAEVGIQSVAQGPDYMASNYLDAGQEESWN